MIISKEKIEEIFRMAEESEDPHQSDALVAIYKMAFPDWDAIKSIEGYPAINQSAWDFIAKCFIKFDREHHPAVLPGGLWMNKGFSWNNNLKHWEVSTASCTISY